MLRVFFKCIQNFCKNVFCCKEWIDLKYLKRIILFSMKGECMQNCMQYIPILVIRGTNGYAKMLKEYIKSIFHRAFNEKRNKTGKIFISVKGREKLHYHFVNKKSWK